jgi:hypothetical protein
LSKLDSTGIPKLRISKTDDGLLHRHENTEPRRVRVGLEVGPWGHGTANLTVSGSNNMVGVTRHHYANVTIENGGAWEQTQRKKATQIRISGTLEIQGTGTIRADAGGTRGGVGGAGGTFLDLVAPVAGGAADTAETNIRPIVAGGGGGAGGGATVNGANGGTGGNRGAHLDTAGAGTAGVGGAGAGGTGGNATAISTDYGLFRNVDESAGGSYNGYGRGGGGGGGGSYILSAGSIGGLGGAGGTGGGCLFIYVRRLRLSSTAVISCNGASGQNGFAPTVGGGGGGGGGAGGGGYIWLEFGEAVDLSDNPITVSTVSDNQVDFSNGASIRCDAGEGGGTGASGSGGGSAGGNGGEGEPGLVTVIQWGLPS